MSKAANYLQCPTWPSTRTQVIWLHAYVLSIVECWYDMATVISHATACIWVSLGSGAKCVVGVLIVLGLCGKSLSYVANRYTTGVRAIVW